MNDLVFFFAIADIILFGIILEQLKVFGDSL